MRFRLACERAASASMRNTVVTVRESDRRALSTALLVALACVLPLLIVLSSQLRIYCIAQGDCSLPVQVGAWLLVPLIITWTLAMLTLAWRAGRLLLTRSQRRSSD